MNILSVRSNFAYEQCMRAGRERLLVHFPKTEFFYPQLSIVTGQKSPPGFSTEFKIVLFLAVVLLSASLAFFIRGLGHQIEQIERGFKDHPVAFGSALDPVSVTVTATLCDDNHRGTRWLERKAPTTTWIPSVETTQVSTASSITPFVIAPSRTDTKRPETTSSLTLSAVEEGVALSSGSSIAGEESGLLPMHHIISVYWPTYDWRTTLEKVLETVDVAWQIFRKVYHYPLDPP